VPEQCAARHPPHVLTLFGRRRYLKHILKKEKSPEFEAAKRKAVNTVCQGSAAEIAKLAMVAVHRRIQEARCAGLPEGNTTLTLQVYPPVPPWGQPPFDSRRWRRKLINLEPSLA
jgi:DNA polymerase I-like protein with 3'-5' exonuclease and polymerase domains